MIKVALWFDGMDGWDRWMVIIGHRSSLRAPLVRIREGIKVMFKGLLQIYTMLLAVLKAHHK